MNCKLKHMKRPFILLLLMLTATVGMAQTCTENCKTCTAPKCVKQTTKTYAGKQTAKQQTPTVDIIYFHSKRRCKTCIAIETATKALTQNELATEVRNGKVKYRVVDITTPEGRKLAKKYKVTWSSLFIVQHKSGKETATDLTQFAFANARSNADGFRKEVKDRVLKLLK